MIPIRDENPTLRKPVVVFVLIGLNLFTWFFLQGFGMTQPLMESICHYGLIPAELLHNVREGQVYALAPGVFCETGGWVYITPITSMFMHGGWFHLIGNMWFLWVFGDNVEDSMGRGRFVIFYLVCGLAAAAAQVITGVHSLVPMVGASGAIGGVMGAYARLFPRAPVHTLVFFFFIFTTVSLPAIVMLGYWFLLQLLAGLPALGSANSGVAFWAHVGGFLAGWFLIKPMHRPEFLMNQRRMVPVRTARHRFLS